LGFTFSTTAFSGTRARTAATSSPAPCWRSFRPSAAKGHLLRRLPPRARPASGGTHHRPADSVRDQSRMITLKDYQSRVLDSLRDFLRQCSKDGRPESAFQAVQLRNNAPPVPYIPVQAAGLAPGMPYVCLRVPTGGRQNPARLPPPPVSPSQNCSMPNGAWCSGWCRATPFWSRPPTRCAIRATITAGRWSWLRHG